MTGQRDGGGVAARGGQSEELAVRRGPHVRDRVGEVRRRGTPEAALQCAPAGGARWKSCATMVASPLDMRPRSRRSAGAIRDAAPRARNCAAWPGSVSKVRRYRARAGSADRPWDTEGRTEWFSRLIGCVAPLRCGRVSPDPRPSAARFGRDLGGGEIQARCLSGAGDRLRVVSIARSVGSEGENDDPLRCLCLSRACRMCAGSQAAGNAGAGGAGDARRRRHCDRRAEVQARAGMARSP